jgi:predicted  nucleic acid-binding Zn-ribbon protein
MRRWLQQPWVIPLTLTAAGWLWVLSGERAVAQAQLAALEANNRIANDRITEMHLTIVAIETDVRWMRQTLDNMREQLEQDQP